MKTYKYPNPFEWSTLTKRPELNKKDLTYTIQNILDDVKSGKDKTLIELTSRIDGIILESIKVIDSEFTIADKLISQELKNAIQLAKRNIENFHNSQVEELNIIETTFGVKCWRKNIGIEKVGLYIPGGSAPLFSTILMLGIPAKIAKCKDIIICTPPDKNGNVNPAILYTAKLVGITSIFKIGGAQAIAAMAYGTETVPQVYKIFGPGNQYVTKAKELVQQEGLAIDMPAGPSEVLIIADDTAIPEYVAADLLSQAEHGADSQVILLSDSEKMLDSIQKELKKQITLLPRKDIAFEALQNSRIILFKSINECIEFGNKYAPEHLIIASVSADDYIEQITTAGSVFLGNYSCESAGDYASGTNHTLPTNGYARNYSGVSVDSFVKKITFQKLTQKGIKNIGPAIEIMAEAEGLVAHKNAVTLRLKNLSDV